MLTDDQRAALEKAGTALAAMILSQVQGAGPTRRLLDFNASRPKKGMSKIGWRPNLKRKKRSNLAYIDGP
jgi:hypothetical protein